MRSALRQPKVKAQLPTVIRPPELELDVDLPTAIKPPEHVSAMPEVISTGAPPRQERSEPDPRP